MGIFADAQGQLTLQSMVGFGQRARFGPVFFPKKSKTTCILTIDFFFYLNTYVFQICKNIWPKSNEGVRLAPDIWVSDQK